MHSEVSRDTDRLVIACKNSLDLNTPLGAEFYYQSLPLCIIDAVYSLGARYKSTQNVVERFCKYFDLIKYRKPKDVFPSTDKQLSVDEFIKNHKNISFKKMAFDIYGNKRETSPNSGIFRSEAVYNWAIVLNNMEVNYFQDVSKIIGTRSFEKLIREIPGQKPGKSLNYFYMLAGSDDYVKQDVWIKGFVEKVLNRTVNDKECLELLRKTAYHLQKDNPNITPRKLDYSIWAWSRS